MVGLAPVTRATLPESVLFVMILQSAKPQSSSVPFSRVGKNKPHVHNPVNMCAGRSERAGAPVSDPARYKGALNAPGRRPALRHRCPILACLYISSGIPDSGGRDKYADRSR
jgi:hypothetical protein